MIVSVEAGQGEVVVAAAVATDIAAAAARGGFTAESAGK